MNCQLLGIDPLTVSLILAGVKAASVAVDKIQEHMAELEKQKLLADSESKRIAIQQQIDQAAKDLAYYQSLAQKESQRQSGIYGWTAVAVAVPVLIGMYFIFKK